MKKIILMFMIISVLLFGMQTILAADDWWGSAQNFMNKGTSEGVDTALSTALSPVIDMLKELLFTIGNVIFLISGTFLGVKYIFAASDGKASIKESFVTLLVAATFFYCAGTVTTFSTDVINGLVAQGSVESASGSIYKTLAALGKVLAFMAAIFLGIKYMMAAPDARADIKKGILPAMLGIVLVFATSSVLNFIATSMEGTLM